MHTCRTTLTTRTAATCRTSASWRTHPDAGEALASHASAGDASGLSGACAPAEAEQRRVRESVRWAPLNALLVREMLLPLARGAGYALEAERRGRGGEKKAKKLPSRRSAPPPPPPLTLPHGAFDRICAFLAPCDEVVLAFHHMHAALQARVRMACGGRLVMFFGSILLQIIK